MVGDIDSQRMVIHIKQGKGRKDRDLPLSPKLLETISRILALERNPADIYFRARPRGDLKVEPLDPQSGLSRPGKSAATQSWHRRKTSDRTPLRHSVRYTPCGIRRGPAHSPSCCSDTPAWEQTMIYLHLSQRHIRACQNPLDALPGGDLTNATRSRKNRKR